MAVVHLASSGHYCLRTLAIAAAAVTTAAAAAAAATVTVGTVASSAISPPDSLGSAAGINYSPLAEMYAPLIKYHPDELYFSSSVDYMWPHYTMLNGDGSPVPGAPSPLNAGNVDFLTRQGKDASGTYLSVPGSPAGDPKVGPGDSYLYVGRDLGTSAPIYAFVVPKDFAVDIYYWVFSPYNLGKKITGLGYVGDHVGDWEHIMVRTLNGAAVSVDYNAHSGGAGEGSLKADDPRITWSGTHPVAYAALGSHGLWPTAGSNVYKTIAGVYKLVDECGDGAEWQTWNNVTTINYRQAAGYTGSLSWLNYNGHYGNVGDSTCWFHSLVGECKFSDGPGHPNRDMTGPPAQVLAAPNSDDPDHSSYTFYLSASAQAWGSAPSRNIRYVAVHQHCGASSSRRETDNWGWTAFVPGTALQKYIVYTNRCAKDAARYAASYEVALCTAGSEEGCASRSGLRELREYNGRSVSRDKGVLVVDVDGWSWNY
ncbi:hypothetical protein DFJ73DRAFT_663451 [Zopfochytrium polystomum]|nr:hypothetical protein DFJ73DRAFT_663451 [Zopfochytrium polystomum]